MHIASIVLRTPSGAEVQLRARHNSVLNRYILGEILITEEGRCLHTDLEYAEEHDLLSAYRQRARQLVQTYC